MVTDAVVSMHPFRGERTTSAKRPWTIESTYRVQGPLVCQPGQERLRLKRTLFELCQSLLEIVEVLVVHIALGEQLQNERCDDLIEIFANALATKSGQKPLVGR